METLFALIGLIIGWFGKSFLLEKGKNLATKQDIGEITRSIESVKSDIHLINEQQSHYFNQQRDSFLDFFDVATTLVLDNLMKNYADFKLDDIEGINTHIEIVHSNYISLIKNYHRMLLFTKDNSPIVNAAGNVVKEANNIWSIYEKHFLSAALTATIILGKAMANNQLTDEIAKSSIEKLENYGKIVLPSINSFRNAYNNYLTSLNKHFYDLGQSTVLESLHVSEKIVS